MNYKYHYRGFDIEELGNGYKVAAYHCETLKEAVAMIDKHIDAKILDLRQRIDGMLDRNFITKNHYSRVMQQVKTLNSKIEELHNATEGTYHA